MIIAAVGVRMTVLKFGRSGFPNGFNDSGKKKIDTCHGVVEIHLDSFIGYGLDRAMKLIAFRVAHGDHISDLQKILINLAIHLERTFIQHEHRVLIVRTVGILTAYRKSKFVARFFSFQVTLELREHLANTKKEKEGLSPEGFFDEVSFFVAFLEFVVKTDYPVFLNLHIIILFKGQVIQM